MEAEAEISAVDSRARRGQVTLWGGPLDGTRVEADPAGEYGAGAYMVVPEEEFRAVYEPVSGGDPDVWYYGGWIA